ARISGLNLGIHPPVFLLQRFAGWPRAVRVKTLLACGAAAALLIHSAGFAASIPAPDFEVAREELVNMLSGFIQVDTTSPPGNETKGAEYLKRFFDREGIPAETLALEPARGNLVARLKGSGKKK